MTRANDGVLAGVVGGEHQLEVVVEQIHQCAQIARPGQDVLFRIEPVADAVRATLDGHIVMERAIAERGRYPAINILKSVSRTMPRAADPAYLPAIQRARQVMATYAGACPARR